MAIPTVTLAGGVAMPQIGFGTWQVGQREVELALAAGYRSLDTASLYGNEADVARAIAASGVPREEVFVTTKVWEDDHGYDATLRSFEASRGRLELDVVDLYLIHWPAPARDLYVETWRALERLRADGAVRAIGVSNFDPGQIDRLIAETGTTPAINQVELNPYVPRRDLRGYHSRHGIVTEAWKPLGRGSGLLRDPVVTGIAGRHGRTPAQVVLRWSLQLGNVVIPRSSHPGRMRENLDVFGFELATGDVDRLSALGR